MSKIKLPDNVVSMEDARLKFGTRTHEVFCKQQQMGFSVQNQKKAARDINEKLVKKLRGGD